MSELRLLEAIEAMVTPRKEEEIPDGWLNDLVVAAIANDENRAFGEIECLIMRDSEDAREMDELPRWDRIEEKLNFICPKVNSKLTWWEVSGLFFPQHQSYRVNGTELPKEWAEDFKFWTTRAWENIGLGQMERCYPKANSSFPDFIEIYPSRRVVNAYYL